MASLGHNELIYLTFERDARICRVSVGILENPSDQWKCIEIQYAKSHGYMMKLLIMFVQLLNSIYTHTVTHVLKLKDKVDGLVQGLNCLTPWRHLSLALSHCCKLLLMHHLYMPVYVSINIKEMHLSLHLSHSWIKLDFHLENIIISNLTHTRPRDMARSRPPFWIFSFAAWKWVNMDGNWRNFDGNISSYV